MQKNAVNKRVQVRPGDQRKVGKSNQPGGVKLRFDSVKQEFATEVVSREQETQTVLDEASRHYFEETND